MQNITYKKNIVKSYGLKGRYRMPLILSIMLRCKIHEEQIRALSTTKQQQRNEKRFILERKCSIWLGPSKGWSQVLKHLAWLDALIEDSLVLKRPRLKTRDMWSVASAHHLCPKKKDSSIGTCQTTMPVQPGGKKNRINSDTDYNVFLL